MIIAVNDGGRYSIEASEDELRLTFNALSEMRPAAVERKLRKNLLDTIEPHIQDEEDDLVPTDEELDGDGDEDLDDEESDLLDQLGG